MLVLPFNICILKIPILSYFGMEHFRIFIAISIFVDIGYTDFMIVWYIGTSSVLVCCTKKNPATLE
jgi:hypothetical protein